jgi:hypothetical protein
VHILLFHAKNITKYTKKELVKLFVLIAAFNAKIS